MNRPILAVLAICLLVLPTGMAQSASLRHVNDPDRPVEFVTWLIQRSTEYVENFDPQDNATTQTAKAEDYVDDVRAKLNGLVLCLRSFTPWFFFEQVDIVPHMGTVNPIQGWVEFTWIGVGQDDGGETRLGHQVYEIRFNPTGLGCTQILPAHVPETEDRPLEGLPWHLGGLRFLR